MTKFKKVFLAVLVVSLSTSNVFGFDPPSCGDPWYYQSDDDINFWVPDKVQHFWGSYLLSEIGQYKIGKVTGPLVAFACGFLWEVKDSKTSLGPGTVGFSYKDLIVDVLGVVSTRINKKDNWKMYISYSTTNKYIMLNVIYKP